MESESYVRPLLQLETVTSVLVIRSDKQFSFQSRRNAGVRWQLRSDAGRELQVDGPATVGVQMVGDGVGNKTVFMRWSSWWLVLPHLAAGGNLFCENLECCKNWVSGTFSLQGRGLGRPSKFFTLASSVILAKSSRSLNG